ncbi:MAG: 50S ribosomal protein L18 [Gammaproteobacteria bacterium]|nr:MAG: 50S ribosomal protein L18 [Gammaproteobacteria bacterium]
MAITKYDRRYRRAGTIRRRLAEKGAIRLCINRTPRHIYAQIIEGDRVLASASTLEADVRKEQKSGGNIVAAGVVGKRIAEKAKATGVSKVACDRSGFRYHGRVKALADAARENGLEF